MTPAARSPTLPPLHMPHHVTILPHHQTKPALRATRNLMKTMSPSQPQSAKSQRRVGSEYISTSTPGTGAGTGGAPLPGPYPQGWTQTCSSMVVGVGARGQLPRPLPHPDPGPTRRPGLPAVLRVALLLNTITDICLAPLATSWLPIHPPFTELLNFPCSNTPKSIFP